MNAYWEKLSAKLDELTHRERLLVLLGVIALVWLLMNSLLLAPVSQHKKNLSDQLQSDREQRVSMQQQLQLLAIRPPVDPDMANRNQLKELNNQIQQENAALEAIKKELVSPEKMASLLEELLKKNKQLKLIALKTLAVVELGAQGGKAETMATDVIATMTSTDKSLVFKHGVELKIQGRYLDLLNYLHTLEKLPWRVLWGNISLVADAYPQSTLTVTIYTLSLDKTWLSI